MLTLFKVDPRPDRLRPPGPGVRGTTVIRHRRLTQIRGCSGGRIECDDRQPPERKGGIPAAEVVPQGRVAPRSQGPPGCRRRSGAILVRPGEGAGLDQEVVEGPPMERAVCQMVRRGPDQRLAELPGSTSRLTAAEQ